MKNSKSVLYYLAMAVCGTMGCGREDIDSSVLREAQTRPSMMRRLIGTMSFSIWDDIVVSEVGVILHNDGVCRFAAPTRNDESTRWTPYQVYWVIFGDDQDVRNGSSLSGFFGSQDLVEASRITSLSGDPAVGFSYVSPDMYNLIDIRPGEYGQGGTTLTTTLNVMGHLAGIRSKSIFMNGTCEVKSEVCNGDVDCTAPGMFEKLGNIRVTQTMVGIPRTVTIDADPQILRF